MVTLHRPANVDQGEKFRHLLNELVNSSAGMALVFPVHPRTRKMLTDLGLAGEYAGDGKSLYLCDPLGYLEFNYLVENAKGVITDSGGITEEATVMGIPCMTLRDNTERWIYRTILTPLYRRKNGLKNHLPFRRMLTPLRLRDEETLRHSDFQTPRQ